MTELATIDWDQVNLDEWVSILTLSGKIPTSGQFSSDQITGTGNIMNGENRLNTETRTQERLDRINVESVRTEMRQGVFGAP